MRNTRRLLTLISLLIIGPWTASFSADSPTLIPFQGRLTNQAGAPYENGQYSLTFNLYDQAVGGATVWTERHEKVGVINGMANIFLGSIQPLASVPFETTKYLGITVDADANPATADPEMVPRTMIIPAFFAKNSQKLAGYDWTPLMQGGVNNPQTGFLRGDKLQAGSVTGLQIGDGQITTADFGDQQVTTGKISDGAITAVKLAVGAIGTAAILDNDLTSADIRDGTIQNVDIADGTIAGNKLIQEIAVLQDQKPFGQHGGIATGGTWLTRALNTDVHGVAFPHPSITLAANRIRLSAGTYRITGLCPAYASWAHQSRVRNITDATTAAIGAQGYANGNNINSNSVAHVSTSAFDGIVVVTGAGIKEFEIQHFFQIGSSSNTALGLGLEPGGGASPGENNVYTTVTVVKLK